jgi:hypothetical protein
MRNHLSGETKRIVLQTKVSIENALNEPYTVLDIISTTINGMVTMGSDVEAIKGFIRDVADPLLDKQHGLKFESVLVYLETPEGGITLNSVGWEPENYDPRTRQWYQAAIEGNGKIVLSSPFRSARSNKVIIAYARCIFDHEGNPLGVILLSVPFQQIRDLIDSVHITDGSYGILMDETLEVLDHPNPEFEGKKMHYLPSGFVVLASALDAGNDFLEYDLKNYEGKQVVSFTARLSNGWILSLSTPKDE